jgi:hypothetical protein
MTIDDRNSSSDFPRICLTRNRFKTSLGNTFHTENMETSTQSVRIPRNTWTYEDLEELALICAHQAYATASDRAAAELWHMAKKYQARAAKFDSRRLVKIGKPPPWVQGLPSD